MKISNIVLILLTSLIIEKTIAQDCVPATSITTLEINEVRSGFRPDGTLWDYPREMGYLVPKDVDYNGSNLGLLYAGIWMSGFSRDGELKLAAKLYGTFQDKTDYWPGPIVGGAVRNESCRNWDRFFRITNDDIQTHKDYLLQFELLNEPYPEHLVPPAVKSWPANGNPYFEPENGFTLEGGSFDFFYDKNQNGIYEPSLGDFPAIPTNQGDWMIPDEMVYWVFNDIGGEHSESNGENIGVEVHAIAYAFTKPENLDKSQFYKYRIINKSGEDLIDFRFGLWLDSELSCRGNSFAGCDTTRNLAFYYTPDVEGINCQVPNVDNDTFPMLGVDFLAVTQKTTNYEYRPMEAFTFYTSPINQPQPGSYPPQTAMEHFILMDGLTPRMLPPGYQGSNTNFAFPSSPNCFNTDSCWNMCLYPSYYYDTRTIQTTGKTNLQQLDFMEVDFVTLYTRDVTFPCSDTKAIAMASDNIQNLYDDGFQPFLSGPKEVVNNYSNSIFPNPAFLQNSTIKIEGLKRFSNLEIFDLRGKLLFEEKTTATKNVSIEASTVFPTRGMYWVKIKTPDGQIITKKLVIQ